MRAAGNAICAALNQPTTIPIMPAAAITACRNVRAAEKRRRNALANCYCLSKVEGTH